MLITITRWRDAQALHAIHAADLKDALQQLNLVGADLGMLVAEVYPAPEARQ